MKLLHTKQLDLKQIYLIAICISIFAVIQYPHQDILAYWAFSMKVFFMPATLISAYYFATVFADKHIGKTKSYIYAIGLTIFFIIVGIAFSVLLFGKENPSTPAYIGVNLISTLAVVGYHLWSTRNRNNVTIETV